LREKANFVGQCGPRRTQEVNRQLGSRQNDMTGKRTKFSEQRGTVGGYVRWVIVRVAGD